MSFGSLAHVAISLKNNRALLKKRKIIKEIRKNWPEKQSYSRKYTFAKASPEQLKEIRIRLQKANQKTLKLKILAFSILLLIGTSGIYFLLHSF